MRKEVLVVVALGTAATVVVTAAAIKQWRRRKERQWRKTQKILRKFARECAIPVSKLWQITNSLVADMETSLTSNDQSKTDKIDMLVSYDSSLPNGDEKGLYYGVNLRATNFLILSAKLGGKTEPITDLHKEEIPIPSNLIHASSQQLCDYMAVEIAKFVAVHPEDENYTTTAKEKKLGFTLSYPVDQSVLSSGSVIKWKNFPTDDPVGKGLVIDINQALEKQGLNLRVYALVDESIGNLAGGRYYNRESVAAVTLGMGTNAAYVESPQSVPKWQNSSPKSDELVISTEWGNFCSSIFPVTEHDVSLDDESSNPGSRKFEKLVSGMYLGEIVRRVLLKMAQETALFGDTVPPKLTVPYILKSPDMAAMHQDTSEDHQGVGEKLREIFEITDSTPMAGEIVAEVCDIVAERGARLVAAGIVAIIKKLGRIENKRSVVIVEGGLYEHYRVFRNYLKSSVWEMLGNELSDNVIVEHSHGCSGAGALFLAASQTQNPKS